MRRFLAAFVSVLALAGAARAGDITYPQLNTATSVADNDILATWRNTGPLTRVNASVLSQYVVNGLGKSTFLQTANNLSELTASAATARANLLLGTAATQNTSTSGANLCLMNANCTWSGTETFQAAVTFGLTTVHTGLATFNGGLTVASGGASFGSTTVHTGLATFNGGITDNGGLGVTGLATLSGGANLSGSVTINGGTPMTTSSSTITANTGTCTGATNVTGNTAAGIFHTTASCAVSGTFIIVFPVSAPTGWVCVAQDSDNLGVVFRQNSFTTNRCTIVVTSTATGPSDGVLISATPF